MATNTPNPTQRRQAQDSPALSLLNGLAIKGKHMIALGCGGLIVGTLLCALLLYVLAYQF